MNTDRVQLSRLTTGSGAFDTILGGGIPHRSLTVLAGAPGAGKTLFALQMLFHLARQGKKCLYLTTLSEPSVKLLGYMQQLSFFDERLIDDEKVIFADVGFAVRQGMNPFTTEVTTRVEREQPTIVVIDSFKAIRDILGDTAAIRTLVYDLAVHSASWGAASIFVGEYTDEEIATYAEFAIADGIIRFANRREAMTAVREVEVLKMRGSSGVAGTHFFEISSDGLEFFPRVRGPAAEGAAAPPVTERVSTGVPGLDSMLGGGVPHASATIVQGATGTGKTLLGLHFLMEGARLGEPGIYFTLEETPEQLRAIAQSLGWELRALEERGLLTIFYTSPVELLADRFLDRARAQMVALGVRRAVIDSLTSLALGVTSERRFKELVYAFTKHFRALGVTVNMNMETPEALGIGQISGYGISFAADNIIKVKYVELEGRLERGISVLKARGVRHESEARRMTVGVSGVEIGAPYEGLRGVFTGLPVPTGEPDRSR